MIELTYNECVEIIGGTAKVVFSYFEDKYV